MGTHGIPSYVGTYQRSSGTGKRFQPVCQSRLTTTRKTFTDKTIAVLWLDQNALLAVYTCRLVIWMIAAKIV